MQALHDGELVNVKAIYINPKDRRLFEEMVGKNFKYALGYPSFCAEGYMVVYRRGIVLRSQLDVPRGKLLIVSSTLYDDQVLLKWIA